MDSTHMLPPPTPLHQQKIGRDLWILFTLLVLEFVCTIVYLKLSARTTVVVPPSHPIATNNDLKKKVLKYLPKLTYTTNNATSPTVPSGVRRRTRTPSASSVLS
ncbi:hypothetical protein Adt_39965 [Abeliophyllum distichum]|uniref:Uncharacterized protein n=1 Tax=Abeliophyllum distichum TaxID=126358 RepID=A0ABD1Q6K0_9LAMI